jgi:hypothetical protein
MPSSYFNSNISGLTRGLYFFGLNNTFGNFTPADLSPVLYLDGILNSNTSTPNAIVTLVTASQGTTNNATDSTGSGYQNPSYETNGLDFTQNGTQDYNCQLNLTPFTLSPVTNPLAEWMLWAQITATSVSSGTMTPLGCSSSQSFIYVNENGMTISDDNGDGWASSSTIPASENPILLFLYCDGNNIFGNATGLPGGLQEIPLTIYQGNNGTFTFDTFGAAPLYGFHEYLQTNRLARICLVDFIPNAQQQADMINWIAVNWGVSF